MIRPLAALLLSLAVVLPAAAQTTPFTKVADTNTAIPDGTGNFVTFSNMVSVNSDGDVAFSESNYEASSNDGIHLWSGGSIQMIADLNTPIPQGTGMFTDFSFFGNGIEGATLAFRGMGSGAQAGIYSATGDTLAKIADIDTPIPGGSGNFTGFTTAYVDEGDFAFIAEGDSEHEGIYLSSGGSLTPIADTNTSVPSIGGTYQQLSSQLGFDGGNISFWADVSGGTAEGHIIGAYREGNGLSTLVTTATTVPGIGSSFTSFQSPADLSGTTVAFGGLHAGGSGIYTIDLAGGAISTIANTSTPVPFGSGNFIYFSPPVIDGGEIAFVGGFKDGSGIFLYQNGRLRPVITTNGLLDGKSVRDLGLSENALAGGYLAFRANFSDGSSGIYRLTISELVDPPAVAPGGPKASKAKAKLVKSIKRVSRQLKKARKEGKRAKVKRLTRQIKNLKKRLRKL